MLRIWGRLSSINVQKVVWCADELGLKYERKDAGGTFGIVNTPEYLAMNPNGLVPAIDDDGFILYESNAVVRYLSAKHGEGKLWPRELQPRADVDRWMEWQSTGLTPGMFQAFWQLVRTPPEKRNAALVEESRVKCEKHVGVLNRHLEGRDFVAGAFSPADIVIGCAVHRWLGLPLERSANAQVERWYASLRKRPGAQQVISQPVS